MKKYICLSALIVSLCLLMGCTGYKYQPDNIVEEVTEFGIKQEFGVDIDLSPSTPETGFSPKSIQPIVKE